MYWLNGYYPSLLRKTVIFTFFFQCSLNQLRTSSYNYPSKKSYAQSCSQIKKYIQNWAHDNWIILDTDIMIKNYNRLDTRYTFSLSQDYYSQLLSSKKLEEIYFKLIFFLKNEEPKGCELEIKEDEKLNVASQFSNEPIWKSSPSYHLKSKLIFEYINQQIK